MTQVETNGDIKNLEGFVKFPDYPPKAKVKYMASSIFIGPESNHCMIALLVTNSLTINCCLADLIDVFLADEDAHSKIVDCLQMLKLVLSKS